MASQYYRLIIFTGFFIVIAFIPQASSNHDVNRVRDGYLDDADVVFVPLERIPRSPSGGNPVKPEEPKEDKSKQQKKTSVVPVKWASADYDGKPKTGGNYKKESGVDTATSDAQHHAENVTTVPIGCTGDCTVISTSSQTPADHSGDMSFPPTPLPNIEISKFFDNDLDKTLREHNITTANTTQLDDDHLYYKSTFYVDSSVGHQYWVDIDNHSDVKISDVLSQSHRRAVTVKLSFDFPFYGHMIRNITIATGGFLYTGEFVHSWLAATQYIAPLMANFDTSLSNNSFVKYLDNGTAFTVQWENVALQERPAEAFTFQCTLFNTGNIVFVYRHVSVLIEKIEDNHHPVKVGLSDAYIINRNIFFVHRKTIYEYHRVQFKKEDIRNWTVIYLSALDTCLNMTECKSCLTKLPRFQCNWCANRCSNGMDRHRQDWVTQGCEKARPKSVDQCRIEDGLPATSSVVGADPQAAGEAVVGMGIPGILGILLMTVLLLGGGVWLFYAYRNPHTSAGQFLIRYRPSQWTWRRGEARYTAATIHM